MLSRERVARVRRIVRRSRFRIFIAIAWFIWTGIIIPIHTRGVIPVAGSVNQHSCCDAEATRTRDNQKPAQPTNCAVCELTAKLSTPITFTIDLRPTGEVRFTTLISPAVRYACEAPLVQSCRGPPAGLMV